MTKLATVGQPEWITPVLVNGWVHFGVPYNTPGYYKDQFGRVWFKGLIKSGLFGGNAIFTLPVGYRPQGTYLFAVGTNPTTIGRIDVDAAGVVIAQAGDPGWISLDSITFSTK